MLHLYVHANTHTQTQTDTHTHTGMDAWMHANKKIQTHTLGV
jgi:hypothetical protein